MPMKFVDKFLMADLSKALLKSKRIKSVSLPSFMFWWSSSTSMVSYVSQDLLARKPCCMHVIGDLIGIQLFHDIRSNNML